MSPAPASPCCLSLVLLLAACSPDPGDTADTGDPPGGGEDTADTGRSSSDSSEDEQLLRDLLAGDPPSEEQVEEVLAEIALSGGLPVRTAEGGFLFACTCGPGDWGVAGSFNDWEAEPLATHGDLHWAELELAEPTGATYKFHDGAAAWEPDPWARRYDYDEYGEYSYVRADQAHLERWPGLSGQGLAERTIRVWVPEGGDFDRTLFVHDGQNLFDPESNWGGWHLQDALPQGILAVGIDNTYDRDYEYTHVEDWIHGSWWGGGGDLYADFVQEDLRPFVEERYGEASLYGTMGSSLGGLISLHIVSRHEGLWDYAASLSGTLGWGSIGTDNETMIEIYAAAGHRDTPIYLDSGGGLECEGNEPGASCLDADGDGIQDDYSAGDNYCETIQMRDTLEAAGYAYEVDLWHWHEPCAEHNEAAWAARVDLPLEVFAGL